jgi:uncharacterized Zn-binding protein involved in type VI secretion
MPFPIAVNTVSITNPAPPAPPPGMVIAARTVICNGQPVATVTDKITPHGDPKIQPLCRSGPLIVTGIPTILVNGLPVAYVGSMCNCGHKIATGVPSVLVG